MHYATLLGCVKKSPPCWGSIKDPCNQCSLGDIPQRFPSETMDMQGFQAIKASSSWVGDVGDVRLKAELGIERNAYRHYVQFQAVRDSTLVRQVAAETGVLWRLRSTISLLLAWFNFKLWRVAHSEMCCNSLGMVWVNYEIWYRLHLLFWSIGRRSDAFRR